MLYRGLFSRTPVLGPPAIISALPARSNFCEQALMSFDLEQPDASRSDASRHSCDNAGSSLAIFSISATVHFPTIPVVAAQYPMTERPQLLIWNTASFTTATTEPPYTSITRSLLGTDGFIW